MPSLGGGKAAHCDVVFTVGSDNVRVFIRGR